MNFIFCKLKNLKKHEFWHLGHAGLKTAQKAFMTFIFASLTPLKKT